MTGEWEHAVRHGELEQVRALIENGADIDARDRYGQTALMIAAMRGHTDIVKLLVESGAALDTTAKFHLSALMLAVINGHTEIARTLAEAGANTSIRGTGAPGFSEKTALDLAVSSGKEEIVLLLRNVSPD